MAIETFNTEEVKTEIAYEEREKIKLEPGQRIRNVVITDFRSGEGAYGKYLVVLMEDNDTKYSMLVNLPGGKNAPAIWHKDFLKTFCMEDPDTGYQVLLPKFEDVPIWIGKGEKQSKSGVTYHPLVWGTEERVENSGSDGVDAKTDYQNQPGTAGWFLQKSFGDSEDEFTAAKRLTDNIGMSSTDAMKMVTQYYSERKQ
jgi:hypothetical protein